jgi:hypothetical protein
MSILLFLWENCYFWEFLLIYTPICTASVQPLAIWNPAINQLCPLVVNLKISGQIFSFPKIYYFYLFVFILHCCKLANYNYTYLLNMVRCYYVYFYIVRCCKPVAVLFVCMCVCVRVRVRVRVRVCVCVWGLNSELWIYKEGTLSYETHLLPIFALVILEMGSQEPFARAGLKLDPPNLSLPST